MGSLVAVSAIVFGRALNVSECLPVGAHVLDQQFVGILTENGDVVDKWQRKVLLDGSFEAPERGANASFATFCERWNSERSVDQSIVHVFYVSSTARRERTTVTHAPSAARRRVTSTPGM